MLTHSSDSISILIRQYWNTITESRPLKSVAREMWGTHDVSQAQLPGNEVAKAHRQLRSLKIWSDQIPNGSFKISLCIRLETMEIQLEQLVLFGSGEMFLSWVKSEGRICISTEPREEFSRKLNTSKHAIASNHLRQKLTSAPWNSAIYPYFWPEISM